MLRRPLIASALLTALPLRPFAGSRAASGSPAVDVALVLAVDASGSIGPEEFRLQREGCAEAVTHPAVLAAIAGGLLGGVAIAMVEWGAPGGAETVVPWQLVRDAAGAEALAGRFRDAPRSPQSWNAIGDALDHAAVLIGACPFEATRAVIDLSGDAPDMRGNRPAAHARDDAVAGGITINALAIEREGGGLARRYEAEVIGGPGAFVMTAAGRDDFARALRAKLVREIAAGPPEAAPAA
ncbi:DUF1194 domain-containing protein [Teichococcus oryzae]|uniref:DUF1194 domain-containing protein n=1 Tax=Teichococcus oryzae TaxID=1608942 RepID=A0A5B2TKQ2_9PROT|nr:DUF1194 domain-containing protein [Pseudoroseomonas oryzae]KAA2215032.1 DUF1194 domain-containing protein [Pseudoroseomonas oryzae]